MMREIDLQKLLEKSEELEVISFLQEVIDFVREIKPVLEQVSSSLNDNIIKMPTATKKLSKVTEATEVATTEIMNIIDNVFDRTSKIPVTLNKYIADRKVENENIASFLDSIYNGIIKGDNLADKAIEIQAIADRVRSGINHEIDLYGKQLMDVHNYTSDRLNDIVMSLQVQDITAQQIAAVNSLLETIQARLTKLLLNFKTSEIRQLLEDNDDGVNVSVLHRPIAFDPDAVNAILTKEDRQANVDHMVGMAAEGRINEIDLSDKASTDNIDAMFAFSVDSVSSGSDEEEISADDIDALFGGAGSASGSDEEISADDIDALFGGNAVDVSEEASADDIDALFNK